MDQVTMKFLEDLLQWCNNFGNNRKGLNSHFQIKEEIEESDLQKIDASKINVGSIWFSNEANFYLNAFVNKLNW